MKFKLNDASCKFAPLKLFFFQFMLFRAACSGMWQKVARWVLKRHNSSFRMISRFFKQLTQDFFLLNPRVALKMGPNLLYHYHANTVIWNNASFTKEMIQYHPCYTRHPLDDIKDDQVNVRPHLKMFEKISYFQMAFSFIEEIIQGTLCMCVIKIPLYFLFLFLTSLSTHKLWFKLFVFAMNKVREREATHTHTH